MLVFAASDSCHWCRRLNEEMLRPELQKELDRWLLVAVNVDGSPQDAESLGVLGVPALRILAPSGRRVASLDGYVPAARLAEWLEKNREAATAAPDEALLGSAEALPSEVAKLVPMLADRDASTREAAVTRLVGSRRTAAASVVRAFREGNLASRLSGMELLGAWRAPIAGLDPWRKETLTEAALGSLDRWAKEAGERANEPATNAPALSPEAAAQARQDIERLLAANDAEAGPMIERLGRLGEPLLPEVAAKLLAVKSDRDRQRLLTLRYRLAADGALPVRWPGGLERLAAPDVRQRQAAADEFAKIARADDQPLLLQLFSDPDPLVREISLRGLNSLGGKSATEALVKLLSDPELNVRASVLKQFTEKPSKRLVPQIGEYAAKESDADLVGHAVRFLGSAGGPEALKRLVQLLEHPQWQVRADAAEAIGKLVDSSSLREGTSDSQVVDAYAALIKLLDDSDSFVVSRAMAGLKSAQIKEVVEPLAGAAKRHPDLAPAVVHMFASQANLRKAAAPHLVAFSRDKDPAVRGASIAGLVAVDPYAHRELIVAALGDPDAKVRTAVADAVFQSLEEGRTQAAAKFGNRGSNSSIPVEQVETESALSRAFRSIFQKPIAAKPAAATPSPPADEKPKPEEKEAEATSAANPWDVWLLDYYQGKGRPKWAADCLAPAEKMLAASDEEERVTAARLLVPLGKKGAALSSLRTIARDRWTNELLQKAQSILAWLTWDDRAAAYEWILPLFPEDHRGFAASGLVVTADSRAADYLWKLLDAPKIEAGQASVLFISLHQAYFGERYSSTQKLPASVRRPAAEAAKRRLDGKGDLPRLVSLLLLAEADRPKAIEAAESLSAKSADPLADDAFQLLLLIDDPKECAARAISGLTASARRRKAALTYLTHGRSNLNHFREAFYLFDYDGGGQIVPSESTPGPPRKPVGLKAEHVRPLLADKDPEVAAMGGYLLALCREPDGLDALVRFWRSAEKPTNETTIMVYSALAAADDESRAGILRDIYAQLKSDRWELRRFYWTIRLMTGEDALRLRKQIRDEVGMEALK